MNTGHVTERAARWLAARTTRRSFLGNVGKVGLLTLGGSVVSTVLTERAEARVCGQSGVSPKCPTFDCFPPSVWGWCWYAGNASCCADGGLKKICDCCRADHPNVHGYCPDGTNVFCVVESCLEDPRVMNVPVVSHNGQTSAALSAQRVAPIAAGSVATIVIAHPTDRLAAALAIPVAARLGGVLLTSPLDAIDPAVAAEIARLGAKRIIVVGPGFTGGVIQGFGALPGVTSVGHLGTNPSIPAASVEVAQWLLAEGMPANFLVLAPSGIGAAVAPVAGSVAGMTQGALLVHGDAAGAILAKVPTAKLTWVGDAAGSAGPGDATVNGSDPLVLSRDLAAARLAAEPAARFPLALAIAEEDAHSVTLVQPGSLAILHAPDLIDPPTRDWLIANRKRLTNVNVAAGGRTGLDEPRVYDVQSAVNGFQAQLLTGSDGMGIPVIPQPVDEMPQGKARVTGPAPARTKPMAKRTTTVKMGKKPVSPSTVPSTSVPAPATSVPPA
jgi:hypothetical protein